MLAWPLMFWKSKKYYKFWVRVCRISTQNAKRVRRVILSSVACLTVPCFCILSQKKDTIFRKTLLNIKFMFWLSLCLLSAAFLVLRIRRDIFVKVLMSICKVPVIIVRLLQLEFPRQIFEKYSGIKFHENPSSGTSVVPCGRTEDGETWWSL